MFSFRHDTSETVYGVLIDVSSGTVGVAIVASVPGEKFPKLLYTHRVTMRVTKHGAEKSENIRRVREALFSAVLTLSQEGIQVLNEYDTRALLKKVYVTCSAPWSYTIARTVNFQSDTPVKVTDAILDDLEQSAEGEILNHLNSIPHMSEGDFSIVERATIDRMINEYPVKEILGKKGIVLGLTHVAGLVPQDILTTITEVQQKLFPNTELRSHTYLFVMYCVLRDVFPRLDSLCIIDVSGEATELAIVENGVLIENVSIPTGSNTFIRDVMITTGKPASDVESYMTMAKDEQGLALSNQFFENTICHYEREIMESLQELQDHYALPKDIILTAQKSYEQFFEPMVRKASKNVLQKEPHILSLRQSVIDELSKDANGDVYLAIGARFFHKMHGCGEVDCV